MKEQFSNPLYNMHSMKEVARPFFANTIQIGFKQERPLPGFPLFHAIRAPVFHGSYEALLDNLQRRDLQAGQKRDTIEIADGGPMSLLFLGVSTEEVVSNRAGIGNAYGYIITCEPNPKGHTYTLVGVPLDTLDELKGYGPFSDQRSFKR